MWKLGEDVEKKLSVSQRIDQGVLRWFRHVKRMGNERMAKRVHESDVRGVRRRGRPRKCWMDGVKEVLAKKGLNIQEAKVYKIGMSGAVCLRGCDMPLVSLQQDV